MVQELYCQNIFTSVRPFLEKFIESTRFILGGSPYLGKDGKKWQSYCRRDTECLNHNMWMRSCMKRLRCCCCCFLRSYSGNIDLKSSSCESCVCSSKLNLFFFLNEPTQGKHWNESVIKSLSLVVIKERNKLSYLILQS